MRYKRTFLWTLFLLGFGASMLYAQQGDVYIDGKGVMRWPETKAEVYGFGANYTVPFAHAYRSAQKFGIDLKAEMEKDIYHFARLGFDAYRVHVWDTEISDTLGNLLDNEHLDAFDFMLKKMQDRGMKMLITPIAFWGNGWPERDTYSPGFSHKYGKGDCLTNEDAIKAQANYLAQFLNHVNPYTGKAYKNDIAIVGFEVSNEPHHRQQADSVTRYISKLITAMRSAGCEKPIFYNFSHGINMVDAYLDAGAQGGTFQWYPTGLGAGEELQGNLLPNVDRYEIPFANNPRFQKAAKVVYEFDAADVGRSYIYPAMARSFRAAGIQWATHFAYDPTFLAYANTEYNTHYMNLAYAPQKALSLKIAGEVFHQIPRYKNFGAYPDNRSFGDFSVSYEEDLAQFNSEEKFFYTNHTSTIPKKEKTLKEIAGWGNSPVVKYDGTGAYFLDKIEKGVWRLEVLPDAVWVDNLFGRNSLDRKLAEIVWNERTMKLILQDLGDDFTITPINSGNDYQPLLKNGSFQVWPGTYLLKRTGVKSKLTGEETWKNIRLNEFEAPESTLEMAYVLHKPVEISTAGEDYTINVQIVNSEPIEQATVMAFDGWTPVKVELRKGHGFSYSATISGEHIKEGILKYYLQVNGKTYPEGTEAVPGDWDFDSEPYKVNVIKAPSPIYLYNALTDDEEVSRPWAPGSKLVPLAQPGAGELQLRVEKLFKPDPENPDADPVYDYSMRYCFKEKLAGRTGELKEAKILVFKGHSLMNRSAKVQVNLISKEGMAYGKVITLDHKTREYRISLDELAPTKLVTLPRPYPSFLPYYFERAEDVPFDVSIVETLQISIGPGLLEEEVMQPQEIALESVWLE